MAIRRAVGTRGVLSLAVMTERVWPGDWADRMAGKDCSLCGALGMGDKDFSVGVFTRGVAEVRLERCSRLPGYQDGR